MVRSLTGPSRRRAAVLIALAVPALLTTFPGAGRAFAATRSMQVRDIKVPTSAARPEGITTGPDGAIWFTEIAVGAIGRFDSGGFTELPLPAQTYPDGIVTGSDGALWFTDYVSGQIGRITTAGAVTLFGLPPCGRCGTYGQAARSIAAGSDGALYYARPAGGRIGRITTDGQITETKVGGLAPTWVAAAPDGTLWFTDDTGVGRMTEDGTVSQVWSGLSYPSSITLGPDGNLWVTGSAQDVVARVTPAGTGKLFPVPLNCDPQQSASGAGAVWFTCYNLDIVGRISIAGIVTRFPVPNHFGGTYPDVLYGIVQGSDGAMWFTEYAANRIGRVATA